MSPRPLSPLPLPSHYQPADAGRWSYRPDDAQLATAAVDWRRQHGVRPAASDEHRVHLLLIDVQKDFCFPEGSLYVGGRSGRGALEDNDRIARFLYRNLGWITEVRCTLDTHVPFQIFSPSFWRDASGERPTAHREVTAAEVKNGDLTFRESLPGALALFFGSVILAWLCLRLYDEPVRKFLSKHLLRKG